MPENPKKYATWEEYLASSDYPTIGKAWDAPKELGGTGAKTFPQRLPWQTWSPMGILENLFTPTSAVPGAGVAKAVGMVGLKTLPRAPRGAALRAGQDVWREAVEWATRRFPRVFNHAEIESVPFTDLREAGFVPRAWTRQHAQELAAQGSPVGRIELTDDAFKARPAIRDVFSSYPEVTHTDAVGDAVQAVTHEGQHLVDWMKNPDDFNGLYELYNEGRKYVRNPFENLANLTGLNNKIRYLKRALNLGKGEADDLLRRGGSDQALVLKDPEIDALDEGWVRKFGKTFYEDPRVPAELRRIYQAIIGKDYAKLMAGRANGMQEWGTNVNRVLDESTDLSNIIRRVILREPLQDAARPMVSVPALEQRGFVASILPSASAPAGRVPQHVQQGFAMLDDVPDHILETMPARYRALAAKMPGTDHATFWERSAAEAERILAQRAAAGPRPPTPPAIEIPPDKYLGPGDPRHKEPFISTLMRSILGQ